MTKFFKRAAAGVLALAMCANLGGCYSEDKTWAAKLGENTLPVGGYIYYLASAYSEGAAKVESGSEVLKADIDGKNAASWVEGRAKEYLYSYYYVDQKFDELGLSLDEDDQASMENAANSMWSAYRGQFESMGIAEASFKEAYAVYNMKMSKLLQAMYGEGGELALSEDELHDYYTGEYVYYQYFIVDLTKTDDEGNTVDMDDDEKATAKEMLDDYAELISEGRQTLDKAAANYANASGTEPNVGEPVAVRTDSLTTVFKDAINGLENDKATVVETTSRYYVVQRLDIEENFEKVLADEDQLGSLLSEMRGTEFIDYTMEQGAALDVQLNDKAIRGANLSKVAEAMGKEGSSSAASSEASSSSSEASSSSSESESSEESSEG